MVCKWCATVEKFCYICMMIKEKRGNRTCGLVGLARGHTDSTRVQLLRYVVVGGVAFVVDWGLLALLTECAGLYYLVSATISFIAGLAMNYALSTTWVFGCGTMQNKWAEFAVFALIGIVGLVLNNVFLWLFTDVVGVHYLISKVVVAAVVMLWNFFARKFILFNRKNNDNGKQE